MEYSESSEQCFVGKLLNDSCHLLTYSRKTVFLLFSDLCESDRHLLLWRAGIPLQPSASDIVCLHHEKRFLSRYESLQKFCCDPFSVRKKHVTKSLRTVNDDLAKLLQLKPGQKLFLCKTCQERVAEGKDESSSESEEEYRPEICYAEAMTSSVATSGCSPLKFVSERDKVGYAKRKVQQMHTVTKTTMACALAVSSEALDSPGDPEYPVVLICVIW